MAAGLTPPKQVFAWLVDQRGRENLQILGNVIDPYQLIETYGLEQTRYFLLREVPFGNDGDFPVRSMVHRMNGDLANDLGNLAQRVLSFVAKHAAGGVPAPGDLTQPVTPCSPPPRACWRVCATITTRKPFTGRWRKLGGGRRRQPLCR